jgi:hypothetical protein
MKLSASLNNDRFLYDYIRRKNHPNFNIIANQPIRTPQIQDPPRNTPDTVPLQSKMLNYSNTPINPPANIFDHESELTRNLRLKYGAMSLNVIPDTYKVNKDPYIFDPQTGSLVEVKRYAKLLSTTKICERRDLSKKQDTFAGITNVYGDNHKEE